MIVIFSLVGFVFLSGLVERVVHVQEQTPDRHPAPPPALTDDRDASPPDWAPRDDSRSRRQKPDDLSADLSPANDAPRRRRNANWLMSTSSDYFSTPPRGGKGNLCDRPGCNRYLAMDPTEGATFGHYFDGWKAAFGMAHLTNLSFVHSAYTQQEVIPGNIWEKFLGLGNHLEDSASLCVNRELRRAVYGEQASSECVKLLPCLENLVVSKKALGRKEDVTRLIRKNNGCGKVFHVAEGQLKGIEFTPDELGTMNTMITKSYFQARQAHPVRCFYDPAMFNVGLHIKRGEGEIRPELYLQTLEKIGAFIDLLMKPTEELKKAGVRIHIFSEGHPKDFGSLKNFPDVDFHLNGDLFETLHNLALSDMVIGHDGEYSSLIRTLGRGVLMLPGTRVLPGLNPAEFNEVELVLEWDSKLVTSLQQSYNCDRDWEGETAA